MEYPKLYEPGQLNLLFNKREFFICIAQGIYTSVLMFFIPYGVFAEATRDDGTQLADYQSFAVTVATSLVIVVSVQVGGGPGTAPTPGKSIYANCQFTVKFIERIYFIYCLNFLLSIHSLSHCNVNASVFIAPLTLPAAAAAKSLQSCPTLCDPIDGSPPGSPVPGILHARTPEWVAISFSNA